MIRTTDALLRALGGTRIALRFSCASQLDTTGASARLGLTSDVTEEVALSPAVVRASDDGSFVCTVSARPVQQQVDIRQSQTAEDLFQSALGVVRDGKLLRIIGIECELFAGQPYLYRLMIRE